MVILDCSLTMAWCFEDETTEYSEKILNTLATSHAWVPALWCIEVANVLLIAERKKRISHTKASAFQQYLNDLLIHVDDYLVKKPIEIILDLARETGLTAYDATYLELAIRKNLPLATLDKDLKNAAKQAGVPLFQL